MAIKKEDLSKYDFVVVIDKSGSMDERDCSNGKMSRWAYAREQTKQFAEVCSQFDDDGIDIVLFSNRAKMLTGVTPDKVDQIFTENGPGGNTAADLALQMVFDAYFDRGARKPMIVVFVTDGEPNDKQDLEDVIVKNSKKLKNDEDFGILFVQVGYDKRATAYLDHLDNGLSRAKFDIVSAITADDAADSPILDLLLAAVNE